MTKQMSLFDVLRPDTAKFSKTEPCYICGGPIGPRGERDHFPIPERHGGNLVAPVCVSCHDLKDRAGLSGFLPEAVGALGSLWTKASTIERITLAKMFALFLDATNKGPIDTSSLVPQPARNKRQRKADND